MDAVLGAVDGTGVGGTAVAVAVGVDGTRVGEGWTVGVATGGAVADGTGDGIVAVGALVGG